MNMFFTGRQKGGFVKGWFWRVYPALHQCLQEEPQKGHVRCLSGEPNLQLLHGNRRIVRKSGKADGQKRSETDSPRCAKTREEMQTRPKVERKQKGGFVKGWFGECTLIPGAHAKVPSFRFSFRGSMRMYARSGFRSGGTCERTLVLVFVPWEHPPKPPFGKPPFWQPRIFFAGRDSHQEKCRENLQAVSCKIVRVCLFYLWLGLLYLRLVLVTYGRLAWSFLLTVDIRFGLFCLQWKIGVVFLTYSSPPSGHWVWSFLLTAPPVQKLGLSFLLTAPVCTAPFE